MDFCLCCYNPLYVLSSPFLFPLFSFSVTSLNRCVSVPSFIFVFCFFLSAFVLGPWVFFFSIKFSGFFVLLHPIPGSSHAHKQTTKHNTRLILMSISSDLSYQPSNRLDWKIMNSSSASFSSVTPHHSTILPPFASYHLCFSHSLLHLCLYVLDEHPHFLLSFLNERL